MTTYRVRDLYVYPVKSAAGIRVEQASLDACGFIDDRRWMLVDGNGRFLSQREVSRLALVRAIVQQAGRAASVKAPLVLEAPERASLTVERPQPGAATRSATIWDNACEVVDCGDTAAAWLREFLDVDCRLVFRPDDHDILVDQQYATPQDRVGLSDGFPLLLIGQGSVDDLNARLTARGESPVPMNRFRPNVVIDGAPALAEDTWHQLELGPLESGQSEPGQPGEPDAARPEPVRLDVVKPCARCSIIPVDQATGIRGLEPLRTLATYRRRDGKVFFGQNLIHRTRGTIRVGDTVRVLA